VFGVVFSATLVMALLLSGRVRENLRRTAKRRVATLGLSLTGVAVVALPRVAAKTYPTPYPYGVLAAILVALWVWFSLESLVSFPTRPGRQEEKDAAEPLAAGWLAACLVGVSVGLAALAYLQGPEPGDGYMAFRGSTTVAGAGAAILAAVVLHLLRGWRRVVALQCAVYLGYVASSRTGVVLLAALGAVVIVSAVWCGQTRTAAVWSSCKMVVAVGVTAALAVVPARLNHFYPYLASRGDLARVDYRDFKLNDYQALAKRYERLFRLISPLAGALSPGRADAIAGVRRRLEGSDGRWTLLLESTGVVFGNAWGYWPRSFDGVVAIRCGVPPICKYPHNLLLEIGFHFGWLPLLVVSAGSMAGVARGISALKNEDVGARVTAICFLGHIGLSMLAGNLFDHVIALGLGLALTWLTAWGSGCPLAGARRRGVS